jgi:acetate CoA-transferase
MNQKKRTQSRKSQFVPILSAAEAVAKIEDEAIVAFCGAGGGIVEATEVINALAARYQATGFPKDLTLYHATGLGDRGDRGMSPLAQRGLVKSAIGGHWGQSPRLAEMAEREEIKAYNLPMGVMSQIMRVAAAGQPGLLTHVGLGTFLDPRQQGGKLNKITTEDIIKYVEIDEKPFLYYEAIYPDVAIIRATTSDTEGYLTMEDEITYVDNLATAMATHNNGGYVIAQVQKVVKAGTLHPKDIRVPGYLVDAIVVVPDQPQLYDAPVNRFMSGDFVADDRAIEAMALTERKVIARRALMAVSKGDIGNVGVGIADGIGVVAREEGVSNEFILTVETGPVGGVSAQGIYFGASINMKAMVEMPSQFDFYDGGGLDICFLSFAELDQKGNVNVHKFNGKIMGTGGFVNICQNAKKIVFCGTLRSGGLKVAIEAGRVQIVKEGKYKKFIEGVSEITFNGLDAVARGQQVIYITERAVFELNDKGIILTEIAPGIDLQKDVLDQMGFVPQIAPELKEMDSRLFQPSIMSVEIGNA